MYDNKLNEFLLWFSGKEKISKKLIKECNRILEENERLRNHIRTLEYNEEKNVRNAFNQGYNQGYLKGLERGRND